jgi:hypothetical protein
MRAVALAVALAVTTLVAAGTAHADVDLPAVSAAAPACEQAQCIEIQLHIAATADALVVAPDWVAGELAEANRHFAPLGIGYVLGAVDTDSVESIADRAARDALAKQVTGRRIHVFVVADLANIDEQGAIFGVTWHRAGKTYLIISAKAWDKTLAHELGHFFGLPHSTYAISIMNKTPRDDPPVADRTFADEELSAMRPVVRRKLRELAVTAATARP